MSYTLKCLFVYIMNSVTKKQTLSFSWMVVFTNPAGVVVIKDGCHIFICYICIQSTSFCLIHFCLYKHSNLFIVPSKMNFEFDLHWLVPQFTLFRFGCRSFPCNISAQNEHLDWSSASCLSHLVRHVQFNGAEYHCKIEICSWLNYLVKFGWHSFDCCNYFTVETMNAIPADSEGEKSSLALQQLMVANCSCNRCKSADSVWNKVALHYCATQSGTKPIWRTAFIHFRINKIMLIE